MKKILIWLLCVMMLSGCRAAQPETPGTEPTVTEPVVQMPTDAETVPESTEPTAAPTAPAETVPAQTQHSADWANYEIVRMDHSVKREDGETLVLFYSDKVVLEEGEAYEGINRILSEAAIEFITDTDIGAMAEQAEQMMVGTGYPFLNSMTAEVTHNAGGVFGIMLTRDWYAGGVGNTDYFGMTFSLREDRAVTLAELFPDVTEERLKDIVWAALEAEYGEAMFEGVWEDLQAYKLEEFPFYIRDGELVLTFPTYTFGPGAAGAMTVPTGLNIGA